MINPREDGLPEEVSAALYEYVSAVITDVLTQTDEEDPSDRALAASRKDRAEANCLRTIRRSILEAELRGIALSLEQIIERKPVIDAELVSLKEGK